MLSTQCSVSRSLLAVVIVLALGLSVAARANAQQQQQMEDVVYLKDGSVIRGTIVEQRLGESILIRTRDGNMFRYTVDQIERITKEPVATTTNRLNKKSPGLAWFLSFLLPGAGQAYNNQWGKAGLDFAGAVIFASLIQASSDKCVNDDECGDYTLGLIGYLAIWIGSQIDAGVSASKINRELEAGLALEFRPTVLPPSSIPGAKPQLGLSLARIRF